MKTTLHWMTTSVSLQTKVFSNCAMGVLFVGGMIAKITEYGSLRRRSCSRGGAHGQIRNGRAQHCALLHWMTTTVSLQTKICSNCAIGVLLVGGMMQRTEYESL